MAQNVTGGYGSYANYGFEATYGAGAVSARTFGHGNVLTITNKNNMEKIFGLGNRNATATIAKKFEGSAGMEFLLSYGSFFRAVLGKVTDTSSTIHTYEEQNTIPSFSIDTGTELGDDDMVQELKGCKVKTCTLTSAIGEPVKVKLECPFKTLALATSGIGSQVAPVEDVYTFAHGTLQLPSGSSIANVQNFELTIENDIEMLWGLGSRLATAGTEKKREYNLKMSIVISDVTTFYTKFLGASGGPAVGTPAETATLIMTFTNGGAGSDLRSIVINLANVSLDTDDMKFDINEVVKEDVGGHARSCTSIVWTNNTAVDAGNP